MLYPPCSIRHALSAMLYPPCSIRHALTRLRSRSAVSGSRCLTLRVFGHRNPKFPRLLRGLAYVVVHVKVFVAPNGFTQESLAFFAVALVGEQEPAQDAHRIRDANAVVDLTRQGQ